MKAITLGADFKHTMAIQQRSRLVDLYTKLEAKNVKTIN